MAANGKPNPELQFFRLLANEWRFGTAVVDWPVHYTGANENQLDVAHLTFVHGTTIGSDHRHRLAFVAKPFEFIMGLTNRLVLNQDRRGILIQKPRNSTNGRERLLRADRPIAIFRRDFANGLSPIKADHLASDKVAKTTESYLRN